MSSNRLYSEVKIMKSPRILSLLLFVTTLASLLVACSGSQDPEDKEHFLSSQQRALEKAKNVNNVLQQADQKQREELEKMER